eukprot:107180-Pleurochrysis_carterae.AAC.6
MKRKNKNAGKGGRARESGRARVNEFVRERSRSHRAASRHTSHRQSYIVDRRSRPQYGACQ